MSSEEKAEEDKAPNASVKSTDVPIDPETEASTHNVKRGEGESENESSKKTKKESKDKDKSKSSGKSKKSRKSKGDKESKKSKSSKKDRDKSSRSKSSKHKRDKTRSRDKDRDTKPERARKRKRSRSPSLHSRSRSPPHRRRRRSPPSRSPYSRHRYSRYSRSPSPYRSFRGDYRSRDRHYRREYRDRDYPRDRDYDRRRRNRDKRSRSRSPRRHRSNSKSSSSSSSDSKSKKDEANPNGSKAAEIKATAPNSLQQISDPAQAQRVMAQSNPLAAFNSVFGNLARAQQLGQQGLMQQLLSGNNPLLMSKIAQELQKTAVEQQTKNAAASLAATTATGLADQSMLFKVHLPGMRSVTAIGGINPQMTRPARRLYVGNLPCGMGLNEQILCEFFGQCCKGLGIATPNPVLSVWLNGEQTFGFIEFRSVQDTNLALQLFEGLQLGGRQLRFGRPVDYKEPPENLKEYVVGEEGDGPNGATNCIEEGSPAAMLLAQQKQQLAMHSAFGLAQVQQQLAEKKRLDLEIMNRQRLMLQRMMGVDTTNTAQLTAAAVMAAQGLGAAAAGLATAGGTAMNVDGVEEEKSVVETKVLMLVNMFKEEDIKEEAEYVDIKDDVKCECQQFGNLVDVVMPKVGEPGCGRVFLKYESVEGAKKCLAKVHGRKFGPNTVEVVYFDEKLFDEKKYGHEM